MGEIASGVQAVLSFGFRKDSNGREELVIKDVKLQGALEVLRNQESYEEAVLQLMNALASSAFSGIPLEFTGATAGNKKNLIEKARNYFVPVTAKVVEGLQQILTILGIGLDAKDISIIKKDVEAFMAVYGSDPQKASELADVILKRFKNSTVLTAQKGLLVHLLAKILQDNGDVKSPFVGSAMAFLSSAIKEFKPAKSTFHNIADRFNSKPQINLSPSSSETIVPKKLTWLQRLRGQAKAMGTK